MKRIICALLLLLGTASTTRTTVHAQTTTGNCITCLGTLTNDTIMYMPLGRYSRDPAGAQRRNGKPLVLFVGALFDGPSAGERWALVKALAQFGTFSGVQATTSNPAIKKQPKVKVPTFSLVHASYRSQYVTFSHSEIDDSYGNAYQKLSVADSNVVKASGLQYLPIIVAGDYMLSRPMVVAQEFKAPNGVPYAFTQLRVALGAHYDKLDALGQLVSDINSETNILTALICHATKGQPTTVCGTKTIIKLMKHVA
jgi:hypothetical protein